MKYNVRVRCEIQQVDEYGAYHGQGIHIEESAQIDLVTFVEVGKILVHCHELVEELQKGPRT